MSDTRNPYFKRICAAGLMAATLAAPLAASAATVSRPVNSGTVLASTQTPEEIIRAKAAALGLSACPPASACPNCKEAAGSAIEDGDDPYREALAYNRSIYFMLAVPYTMAGVGGFYCYRHLRRNAG